MLKTLHIQNYAIIEEIEVNFSPGLNILTGETGAGKSILMGALSLVLGDRADTSVLLNPDKKCFVEAVFDIRNHEDIGKKLEELELDQEDELIIRREIGANGKTRAFVNDSPVNLETLRSISYSIVDLHRQFDLLELGEESFQRKVIDGLAGNASLLEKYREIYREHEQLKKTLQELVDTKNQAEKELDYHRFLFEEIDSAGFRENEIEDAETEMKILESSEGIRAALEYAEMSLDHSDQALLQQLKSVYNQLHHYEEVFPGLKELNDRIQSVHIELKDIAMEISRLSGNIESDPRRLEMLQERVSEGYKLFKKHGVGTTAELLQIKASLEEKLDSVLNMDDKIKETETAVKEAWSKLSESAEFLSKSRKKVVKTFQEQVTGLLGRVGMPNARFKVAVTEEEPGLFGKDKIEFLFDGNRSDRFEPVKKVASGGELSRLMLCIKSLVAKSVDLPTMIFDEIDTGISGEAARQVGIIMKELAASRQIIAITHQPQIAGKADAHYFVYKQSNGKSIHTGIRLLNEEESILAIAKMISGEQPTQAALEHAREMVK